MEITVKEFKQIELVTIIGRVDSVEAARLAQALESASERGRYKLVIDMSQLEYMSSAGFRALAIAQRNSKRYNRGEVVLTQVPEQIQEALDLVGFTEYFNVISPISSAIEYIESLPAGVSTSDPQSSSLET